MNRFDMVLRKKEEMKERLKEVLDLEKQFKRLGDTPELLAARIGLREVRKGVQRDLTRHCKNFGLED